MASSLTAGHPLALQLKPREFTAVDVAVMGGKYNEIRIEWPGSLSRGVFLKAGPADLPAASSADDPYPTDPHISVWNTRCTATLWSADDAMSSRLMESFYRELVDEHLAEPTALRSAQLHMLETPVIELRIIGPGL